MIEERELNFTSISNHAPHAGRKLLKRLRLINGGLAKQSGNWAGGILDDAEVGDIAVIMQLELQHHLAAIIGGVKLLIKQTEPAGSDRFHQFGVVHASLGCPNIKRGDVQFP